MTYQSRISSTLDCCLVLCQAPLYCCEPEELRSSTEGLGIRLIVALACDTAKSQDDEFDHDAKIFANLQLDLSSTK